MAGTSVSTARHVAQYSARVVFRPTSWQLWRLPSAAIAWLLAWEAVTIAAIGLVIAREPLPTAANWLLSGLIGLAAAVHTVATRPAEERRRGARLQLGQVEHVDQSSIWFFSAAMVLPVALAISLVAAVRLQRYLISRRTPSRWLFSSCSIALSVVAAHLAVVMTPAAAWLAGRSTAAPAAAAGIVIATVLYFGVQALLVGIGRGLASGQLSPPTGRAWSLQHLLGTRDDNVLIVYTLLLGVFAMLAEAFAPVALIAVVLVAIRNTRSEQRMAQLRIEREQLQVDALHDALTGLPNRRGFEPQAELALVADAAQQAPTAVLMADLDHFKDWNTRLGHFGADQLLTAVARALRGNVRATDLLCRWGGEEIALLFPATSRAEAAVLAERLRAAVADISLRVSKPAGGADITVTGCTVSMGVAVSPANGTSLAELQERADQALQVAKDSGRNQVQFACHMPPVPHQRNRPPQQPAFPAPQRR